MEPRVWMTRRLGIDAGAQMATLGAIAKPRGIPARLSLVSTVRVGLSPSTSWTFTAQSHPTRDLYHDGGGLEKKETTGLLG